MAAAIGSISPVPASASALTASVPATLAIDLTGMNPWAPEPRETDEFRPRDIDILRTEVLPMMG